MKPLTKQLARETGMFPVDADGFEKGHGRNLQLVSPEQLEAFAQAVAKRCAVIVHNVPVDAFCTDSHFRQRDNQRKVTADAILDLFGIDGAARQEEG